MFTPASRINDSHVSPSARCESAAPDSMRGICTLVVAVPCVEGRRDEIVPDGVHDRLVSKNPSSTLAAASSWPFGKVGQYKFILAACCGDNCLHAHVLFEIDVYERAELNGLRHRPEVTLKVEC